VTLFSQSSQTRTAKFAMRLPPGGRNRPVGALESPMVDGVSLVLAVQTAEDCRGLGTLSRFSPTGITSDYSRLDAALYVGQCRRGTWSEFAVGAAF